MAIPTNKEELKTAITFNYEKLKTELLNVPPHLAAIKELEGHAKGTKMSVNDLVSYLVGWGELVLKWNREKEKGNTVDFPETGYKWNELGKLAQKFYADYAQKESTWLLKKLDNVVGEILSLIDTKTNQQLYKVAWYDKWTLGRLIQFNTSSPHANAKGRVRKWKKEKGLK